MEYAIVIEKANETWSAHAPDLPGCIATGETIEEVKNNMRTAIEWHIEALRESGEDVPEPTVQVAVVAIPAPKAA
ncbi:MAG: type II toxin-antitoxin system HicB family antitoxin [Acidobacteria bacterium]|nr:type II toxin-antitoxin system HicB family antitoxin [Acidobacteriota bacterium]